MAVNRSCRESVGLNHTTKRNPRRMLPRHRHEDRQTSSRRRSGDDTEPACPYREKLLGMARGSRAKQLCSGRWSCRVE